MNNVLEQTMLLGLDSASKGNKSILAGVGTINSTFSLMASATTPNEGGDHKFTSLLLVATKCL